MLCNNWWTRFPLQAKVYLIRRTFTFDRKVHKLTEKYNMKWDKWKETQLQNTMGISNNSNWECWRDTKVDLLLHKALYYDKDVSSDPLPPTPPRKIEETGTKHIFVHVDLHTRTCYIQHSHLATSIHTSVVFWVLQGNFVCCFVGNILLGVWRSMSLRDSKLQLTWLIRWPDIINVTCPSVALQTEWWEPMSDSSYNKSLYCPTDNPL
jgi:hypothetical protein